MGEDSKRNYSGIQESALRMKQLVTSVLKNPLFSGSLVMVLGSNIANILNYAYHLLMGRILGPADYGTLASLISLLGLLAVIPQSFGLAITKFISSARSKAEIEVYVGWLNKVSLIIGGGICFLILISIPLTSEFFNIHDIYLWLVTAFCLLFIIPTFFYRAALNGLLRFKETVISSLVENFLKLGLGILFVLLGFSVFGGLLGLLIGALLGLFLANFFIRDYRSVKKSSDGLYKESIGFAIPVLLQSVSMASIYSADLLLVKHFFSSTEAGFYAALSSLGRIIFFGCGPIASVMFPIIANRFSQKRSVNKVFYLSLIATFLLCGGVTLAYWLFPDSAIRLMFGDSYLVVSPLLVWVGIFMSLYTLSTLVINFFLSVNKLWIVVLPIACALMQIIGIWFFHDSLYRVVMVSILSTLVLFVTSMGYFLYFSYLKKYAK